MQRCVLAARRGFLPRPAFVGPMLLAALVSPFGVLAQATPGHRSFPAHALRGELAITAPPEVLLNGSPDRLAPGARIRGEDNLVVVSGNLAGRRMVVHYTREAASGQLMDVWILRPVEIANRPWPRSEQEAARWAFDPLAQTWSRP